MKKCSFEVRAFRDKYLAALALLLMMCNTASAQFTYHVYVPQWYNKVRVDTLMQVNGKSTFKDTITANKVRLITNNFAPGDPDSLELRIDNSANTGAAGILFKSKNSSSAIDRAWVSTTWYGSGPSADMGLTMGVGSGTIFSPLLSLRASSIAANTSLSVTGTTNTTSLVTGAIKITGNTPASGKVLTSDASGNATWSSGLVRGIKVITANDTLGADDYTVINRATSGTPLVTFPSASSNIGRIYVLVEEAANVTANGMGWTPEVTYKGSTYTSWVNPVFSSLSRLTIQSDGTNWVVIDGM